MIRFTDLSLYWPEVVRFRDRVAKRFRPRGRTDCLVIFPCSSLKPYSASKSHRLFAEASKYARRRANIREVILTSPIGTVPRELEKVPPAGYYDIAVTGRWSEEEIRIVSRSLTGVIESYARDDLVVVAHVSGGYREICRRSESELGQAFEYTVPDRPTSPEALRSLEATLGRIDGSGRHPDPLEPHRLVLSFQYGEKVAERMVEAPARIAKGDRDISIKCGDNFVARLNSHSGLFIPGTLGMDILSYYDRYFIDIDFELTSKVLYCPGVVGADPEIRPGDEVVIRRDGQVVGQGRSILGGETMVRSDRGRAVVLRELLDKPASRHRA